MSQVYSIKNSATKKFHDRTSQAIIHYLQLNSRLSWQQLGRLVHLSGQAVAERVRQMQDAGVITAFTIKQNLPRQFIYIKMTSPRFYEFEQLLLDEPNVVQADKISGDYCYQLTFAGDNKEELEQFLQRILPFGLYKVAQSIKTIKD